MGGGEGSRIPRWPVVASPQKPPRQERHYSLSQSWGFSRMAVPSRRDGGGHTGTRCVISDHSRVSRGHGGHGLPLASTLPPHPATCSECCLKFLWVTRPLPSDQAFVSSCRITSLLRGLPPATRKHFGVEMPPLEGAPPGARAQGSLCQKVTGSSKR